MASANMITSAMPAVLEAAVGQVEAELERMETAVRGIARLSALLGLDVTTPAGLAQVRFRLFHPSRYLCLPLAAHILPAAPEG
jgi:hypothetical protein